MLCEEMTWLFTFIPPFSKVLPCQVNFKKKKDLVAN